MAIVIESGDEKVGNNVDVDVAIHSQTHL